MAKGQKYYVVWKGKTPGVYSSWEHCQEQIKGMDAVYKSFPTEEEALQAFREHPAKHIYAHKKPVVVAENISIMYPSIAVDAACSGNPGRMEYQGVDTKTKELIFHQGPYEDATNNIGEFLALVHGLSYLQRNGHHETPIYSDSVTAMAWVRNKKAKTILEHTPKNQIIFELIERAEHWLKTNTYKNPIIKWNTEVLGEIPADFGRK